LAASAHLALEQTRLADQWKVLETANDLEAVRDWVQQGVNLVTGPVEGERTEGLPFGILSQLAGYCRTEGIPFLIEADGSRRLPLKVPAPHEPPIPPFVDTVLVVAGLSALGQSLTSEWVYQPERFGVLAGLEPGDPITPNALLQVLLHPQGGLKNIPSRARRVVLLNQADTAALQRVAAEIQASLLKVYDAVVAASLNPQAILGPGAIRLKVDDQVGSNAYLVLYQPVAAVVLAAGGATRFGQPKQLLPWQGRPLVWHAAHKAVQAGLSPVIVVAGSGFVEIKQATADLPVQVVHNPDWSKGQSTSVRAGMQVMPSEPGAVIFLLVDQPYTPTKLLQKLVAKHSVTRAPIVAPLVEGRRANPVLFDRDLFTRLASLRGDAGGRLLFDEFPATYIHWKDLAILLDIDSPEDYRHLLNCLE
jgi:molybdenum cofactor cytidylyltransferase